MTRWDKKRWVKLKDGSYRRRVGVHLSTRHEKPIYASMTLARLQAEAERRGLKTYGSKKTLAERLEKHDGST